MSEEIQPAGIQEPRRVRPLARERRREKDDQFHRRLAEVAGLEQSDEQGGGPAGHRPPAEQGGPPGAEQEPEPGIGQNLDVST